MVHALTSPFPFQEDALSDEEPEDHTAWVMEDDLADRTNWGAKMTKATMVPPVSRKYELIDEYRIVSDEAMVRDKMRAQFPDFILNKLTLHPETGHNAEIIVHPRKPRKILGEEVLEQEVYGIDPYTHNLLLATMRSLPKTVKACKDDEERRNFIEQVRDHASPLKRLENLVLRSIGKTLTSRFVVPCFGAAD